MIAQHLFIVGTIWNHLTETPLKSTNNQYFEHTEKNIPVNTSFPYKKTSNGGSKLHGTFSIMKLLGSHENLLTLLHRNSTVPRRVTKVAQ